MPANLTPQYLDAEEAFKKAGSTEEKVSALELMLRVIPKHKGTEKLQADLKRRLSRLRKDAQKEKASGAHHRPFHHIDREGEGRVVLCGPPNSGKSQLLASLTNAEPEIAPYPFTTRAPLPGMMQYEDIQIQLIDTPPLSPEVFEPWQIAMIEQSDLALLIFDVNDPDVLEQTEYILELFAKRGVPVAGEDCYVIVLGNKIDFPGGKESFAAWKELFSSSFEPRMFCATDPHDLQMIKQTIFERLEIVRVYTKTPGGKVDENPTPFVLKKGSSVLDAAAAIHKDLAASFKYARIWGQGKYEGQMVERGHILEDCDLLEVHT